MIQKLRVPAGFIVAAVVLYFAQPNGLSILAGLPVAISGAVFRALAAGVIQKDTALATSGVYALTRNPLYLGSSMLAAGFAIMSASQIAAAVLLIPFALIYPRVILREEAHLQNLFPDDFRLYKAKVPRFFPRPGWVHLSFSLDHYLANREYNTAVGLAAAVAVLILKWRFGLGN